MSARTGIEWTEATWSPVTGCSKVSPGCAHCYAERMAHRLAGRVGYDADEPFRVTLRPEKLGEPLRWKRPRRVFVCSMGDLFHEDVPDEFIAAVFGVMAEAHWHIFQVLTKRPARMAEWCELAAARRRTVTWSSRALLGDLSNGPWPLPNVWLGVTAEDQKRADERIPLLLQIPAAVRFVSLEPLLGPIDLERQFALIDSNGEPYAPRCDPGGASSLGWVIVGGETGPGARSIVHPGWVRDIRDQCQEAGVAFFFKNWGGVNKKRAGRILDGRTWDEMPEVAP